MRSLLALMVATVIWLAVLPRFYGQPREQLADALAARQLAMFSSSAERERLRASNPEWDFMRRAFVSWAMANRARPDPSQHPDELRMLDAEISETLDDERRGADYFLMAYGKGMKQSLFVDSEIALMLGRRVELAENAADRELFRARVLKIAAAMESSPLASAESYPDEYWTFDNTNALAALKLSDRIDGTNHEALIQRWLAVARAKLLDPPTGMLVSSFRGTGQVLDGPEGSSIWMDAVALADVDPAFAKDQYERAKKYLGHSIVGFGVAREWPAAAIARPDIDSGIQIPIVEASPSSSAFALMAANRFGDSEFAEQLIASLDYAAFPVSDSEGLTFAAGNQVGDAVLLFALTEAP